MRIQKSITERFPTLAIRNRSIYIFISHKLRYLRFLVIAVQTRRGVLLTNWYTA